MNLTTITFTSLFLLLGCSPKAPPVTKPTVGLDEKPALAPFISVPGLQSVACASQTCTLYAADGVYEVNVEGMTLKPTDEPPRPPEDVWPARVASSSLAEDWNARTKNAWRSPFQATIPSPDGGVFKLHRSATPGTSRIARIGGHVMTARQGLDPDSPAYPWTLALHPTGTEAYHIAWSNPDVIAFNTRTLETSWRIRLSGPAVGLFVSADGRYLVAEIDSSVAEEQLLDFVPVRRQNPNGGEPFGDGAWSGIHRPIAKRTVLVDLKVGAAVAEVPGSFVSFQAFRDGALISGSGGVARATWSPD